MILTDEHIDILTEVRRVMDISDSIPFICHNIEVVIQDRCKVKKVEHSSEANRLYMELTDAILDELGGSPTLYMFLRRKVSGFYGETTQRQARLVWMARLAWLDKMIATRTI
jgi:hypothetical protein